MAFVYQGAGKKVSPTAERSLRECKQEACDIQWCLAKSNTNFKRCAPQIELWQQCFDRAREKDEKESAESSLHQRPQLPRKQ